jgi:hypothetical protein
VPVVWTVHRWESKRPRLASRPVVPLAMMMTTGGISGLWARMACQVSSSMVNTRLADSKYPSGLPTSVRGGAAGPVAVGVVLAGELAAGLLDIGQGGV